MKITKTQLKQIIKEELGKVMEGIGSPPMGSPARDEYNYPPGMGGNAPSCEDLLKQLRHAEAEMKQHDPRQMGMAGGMAPYDIEGEYKKAAEDYNRVKAEMEKQNCPMP
tara:strand:+ start:206 stop:532 length:327 start_codon:yes stop_codon:yes gene_type:complete